MTLSWQWLLQVRSWLCLTKSLAFSFMTKSLYVYTEMPPPLSPPPLPLCHCPLSSLPLNSFLSFRFHFPPFSPLLPGSLPILSGSDCLCLSLYLRITWHHTVSLDISPLGCTQLVELGGPLVGPGLCTDLVSWEARASQWCLGSWGGDEAVPALVSEEFCSWRISRFLLVLNLTRGPIW